MRRDAMNHGQCLTDEMLTEYLEGGLDPAVRAATEAHLVACEKCRVRLAYFMRLLKQEIEPAEELALSAAQQAWTRRQGHRQVLGTRLRRNRRWTIASGGIAAAVAFAVGTAYVVDRIGEPRSAEEVIQLLLAEKRPFETRISGQPYSPYTSTRGPGDTGSSYSLLTGQMRELSASAYEMGKFYLLQKDFGRAIEYLALAEREPGASADVHNDYGVALLESGNASNVSKAATEFRHALSAKSDYAPAVFNLAILYERTDRPDLAVQQWTKSTQLEPNGDWSKEAKSKLEGIKR
jgi:tetratricopeptide (TPR) repeat protein